MSVHEQYGYETPAIEASYEGLLIQDGKLFARTLCISNGEPITVDNSLTGFVDMLLFSQEIGEELSKETEIRPFVDLAFATIAFSCGPEFMVNADGSAKSIQTFLQDGLKKLQEDGRVQETIDQLLPLFNANQDLWPKEPSGLLRTIKNLSHQPRPLNQTPTPKP